MEQKPSRKEKAAETKRKIFETAIRLIKEKGYDNITISEISKASGVAKGSFYVHYKSKEDIVRESYYADMGQYIQDHYESFLATRGCLQTQAIQTRIAARRETAKKESARFSYLVEKRR